MDIEKLLKTACSAAKAGHLAIFDEKTNNQKVEKDLDRDVKIYADRKSEKAIINFLSAQTTFSILAEESGWKENKSDYIWIIDPIDGSLNFSRDIPLSCISIALWKNNKPVLGVIFDFNHNNLYTGIVGKGAWLNGKEIKVNNINHFSDAILCTGFPVSTDFSAAGISEFVEEIRKYKKVRLLGTAALSLAFVACGKADAYKENNIKLWDVAAGLAIVKSAGGIIEYTTTVNDKVLNVTACCSDLIN